MQSAAGGIESNKQRIGDLTTECDLTSFAGKNIGESVYLEPSGEISVTYGNDQIARLRNQ